MTTHTALIDRLRAFPGSTPEAAADALESLEQLVAALVAERAKSAEQYVARLNQIDALTKERNELEISNAFAHGEWRAVKGQLAAAQAREAKLRTMKDIAYRIVCDYARDNPIYEWMGVQQDPMGAHAWLEEFNNLLALPADDSALMERLKQEREQLIDDWTTTIATCYKSDDLLTAEQVVDLLCSSAKKSDAIRNMT